MAEPVRTAPQVHAMADKLPETNHRSCPRGVRRSKQVRTSTGQTVRMRLLICASGAMLLGALGLTGGCQSAKDARSEVIAGLDPDYRVRPLTLQMHEYALTFSALVEHGADQIAASTDDSTIRRNALLWKVNAIPAMRVACFRPDPLSACLDAWTLARQMDDFFTTGAGAAVFGDQQAIAVNVSHELAVRIRDIGSSVARSPAEMRTIEQDWIDPWVEANRIDNLHFLRESSIDRFAELAFVQGGTWEQFASIEEQAIRLMVQTRIYLAELPKMARWQAELFREEALDDERIHAALHGLQRLGDIAEAANRATTFADQLPALVQAQREALEAFVQAQREAIEELFARERSAIFAQLADERVAVFEGIDRQRDLLIAALDEQRIDTHKRLSDERAMMTAAFTSELTRAMEAITAERIATVQRVNEIAVAALAQSEQELERVVDHLIWRVIQVAIAAIVVTPIIIRVYMFVLRPRKGARGMAA